MSAATSRTCATSSYEATLRRDPNTDAPTEACFELKEEPGLRDRDVLTLQPPTAATRIAISLEKVPPVGIASVASDVAPGPGATLRVPAKQIAPELRAHARTICIGEDRDVPGSATGPVTIELCEVRTE